ncbi:MAG: hypothetical protein AAF657_15140 [Acidobacteriota bacterium]
MAQGMFRLAGRNDLGLRFRPILQRALRRLKSEEGESGESQTSGEVEGSEVEPGVAEPTAAEPNAVVGTESAQTTA